jgi:carboxyl-terminal processing protease
MLSVAAFKVRLLFWVPIILIALACRSIIPLPQASSSQVTREKIITGKVSPTHLPTLTLVPTQTFTPTSAPPTPTLTPSFTSTPVPTSIPIKTQLSIFNDLWRIVHETYIYPDFNGLDWDAIHDEYRQKIQSGLTNQEFYQAMSDVINQLGDEHSFFLNPQQVAEQEAEYQGEFDYVGIGILVSAVPERNRAVIISVFPGSPAEVAGLQPRDSIISVDGTPILDERGYLRDIVRGIEGTTIDLTVQSPGGSLHVLSITRHRISGETPLLSTLINTKDGKRIGYILLVTFADSTVVEKVADAIRSMTADAPIDGLIIDNRMNNGGISTVMDPILGYFIGGTLGSYIQRDDQRPLEVSLNDINGSSKVPLVVLIGSETVSFGEIFAGILQDVGRAYLIGTTTKGNVEILWGYDMEDGSQLWLANETFRPLNHPDQDWEQNGVIPDLTVSGDFDEYSFTSDPAVLAAVKYLSGK